MRIVVDGLSLRVRSGGVGRYTRELLRHLCRLGSGHEWFLSDVLVPYLQAPAGPVPAGADFDDFIGRCVARSPLVWQAAPFRARLALVRRHARALGARLYFGSCFFGVFDPSFKTVLTLHDLAYLQYPRETNPFMLRHLRRTLPGDAHRAGAVFADSEATRRDVIDRLGVPGQKVHVVYNGVDPSFRPLAGDPALERVRRRYALPERFLLSVSTVEPRKNFSRLLDAFDALTAQAGFRHALVIVGDRGWKDRAIRDAMDRPRPPGRLLVTGHVPGDDLPALYNLADVLVMPSLHEGFGLPVLEAMACGTPVVTSNTSALPEVAGGAAVLVDPLSVEGIAAGIRRAVEDAALREDMRARGLKRATDFSWERSARAALSLFEQLAGA